MDEQRKQFELALDIVRHEGMGSSDALDLSEYLLSLGYVKMDWIPESVEAMESMYKILDVATQAFSTAAQAIVASDPAVPLPDSHTAPEATDTGPGETPDGIPLFEPEPDIDIELDAALPTSPPSKPFNPTTRRGDAKVTTGLHRIAYGTKWTDPNNEVAPKPGQEREMSGWTGMSPRLVDTMMCFIGDKGRVVASPTWIAKHARFDKSSQRKGSPPRTKVYIRQAPNALVRRGLLEFADKDLYQLSPRGRLWVREYMNMEPTEKHVGVNATD